MVKIRLKRMGRKKRPFYRIVAADSRTPRDGRALEELGYYDPMTNPKTIKVNLEGVEKWIGNGAQFTPRVAKLVNIYRERQEEENQNIENQESVENADIENENVEEAAANVNDDIGSASAEELAFDMVDEADKLESAGE